MAYNWVDYIIIAIFFLSALSGFGRGFVREVISIITWIAAFVIAIMFASHVATLFTSSPQVAGMVTSASSAIGANTEQPVSYAALAISFAILFAGTLLIGALIGHIINSAIAASGIGIINRLLGAVFGLARGFLIVLVLIFLVQLTPMGEQPYWRESQFVVSFQPAVQYLADLVSPTLTNLKAKLGETMQNVDTEVQGAVQGAADQVKSLTQ